MSQQAPELPSRDGNCSAFFWSWGGRVVVLRAAVGALSLHRLSSLLTQLTGYFAVRLICVVKSGSLLQTSVAELEISDDLHHKTFVQIVHIPVVGREVIHCHACDGLVADYMLFLELYLKRKPQRGDDELAPFSRSRMNEQSYLIKEFVNEINGFLCHLNGGPHLNIKGLQNKFTLDVKRNPLAESIEISGGLSNACRSCYEQNTAAEMQCVLVGMHYGVSIIVSETTVLAKSKHYVSNSSSVGCEKGGRHLEGWHSSDLRMTQNAPDKIPLMSRLTISFFFSTDGMKGLIVLLSCLHAVLAGQLRLTNDVVGGFYPFVVHEPETNIHDFDLIFSSDNDLQKPWPLLIFLHGRGCISDDNNWVDRAQWDGVGTLLNQWNGGNRGGKQAVVANQFLTVLPVARKNYGGRSRWLSDHLIEVINKVKSRYTVDSNRIYVTGYSMGAFGTWRFSIQHPDRCLRSSDEMVAAAVASAGFPYDGQNSDDTHVKNVTDLLGL
ncbi:peptidase [Planoprotostelium fungivorum]|uniref:Peptidase n=1 Tax=Planoprotostelium fungivorum TaxID=1890364 RepID=A0A2P6N700_9EUKA|nr:peptidase [Planoprotostelium fungivorum]